MPRYFDWNNYERSGARPVAGGIRAQTERGAFTKNWWAKRWLAALESFQTEGRLARGRTYARKGQVISIDIKEGHVDALVQGSRPEPYKITLSVRAIPELKWLELSRTSFNQPSVATQLISGDMPQDVERLFAEHQLSLFPSNDNDLETSCSCPDHANPCKHIAAVYYLLGEEFDRDPFLIFRLRGMSKERLLDLLIGTVGVSQEQCEAEPPGATITGMATGPVAPTRQPLDVQSFWKVAEITNDLVGSTKAPSTNASLIKRLGNLPFWRSSQSFSLVMEDTYQRASERALQTLLDETLDSNH